VEEAERVVSQRLPVVELIVMAMQAAAEVEAVAVVPAEPVRNKVVLQSRWFCLHLREQDLQPPMP